MANSASIIAGGAAVVLSVQDETRQKLSTISEHFKSVAGGLAASFKQASQVTSQIAQSIYSQIQSASLAFASFGDSIAKAARRTSTSASAFSELDYAVERSGGNVRDLENALRTMNRTIAQAASGSTMAREDLAALNLTLDDLSGLSPDQALELIAERLKEIPNPVLRAERAMAIFGRAGARILPMLNDDIAALRQQARDLGIGISDDDAASAEALTDALTNFNRVLKSITISIGAAVAPALTQLLEDIALVARGVTAWIKENRQLIVIIGGVAAAITAIGATLATIAGAASLFSALGAMALSLKAAIVGLAGIITTAFSGLIGFAFTPVGAAIISVVGALALLYRYGDGIKELTEPVRQGLFSIQSAIENLSLDGIIDAFRNGLRSVATAIKGTTIGRAMRSIAEQVAAIVQSIEAALGGLSIASTIGVQLRLVTDSINNSVVVQAMRSMLGRISDLWRNATNGLRSLWRDAMDRMASIAGRLIAPIQRVLSASFQSIRDTFSEAFSGITDALFAGDLSGALELAGLSLQTTWANIVATLRSVWRSFTAFLVDSFWNAIEFVGTTAIDVFRRMVTTLRDIVNGIGRAIESMIMTLIEGVNQAVADARIAAGRLNPLSPSREEITRDRIQANRAARQFIAEIATQRERRLDDLIDPILRGADRARQAVRDIVPDDVRNREQQLRDAEAIDREPIVAMQRQMRDLIERQRIDREIQEMIRWLQSFGRDRGFNDEFDLDGMDMETRRFEATGTFSAAAAMAMAGSDTVAERTARSTEETARTTREIARRLERLSGGFE